MPMIYVSEKTARQLDELSEYLRKNTNSPVRVLKTDVISAALTEYAKKVGKVK
jgi:hypothetical protein